MSEVAEEAEETAIDPQAKVAELEKTIVKLAGDLASTRQLLEQAVRLGRDANDREKETRAQFADLKERLVNAEADNQRMRGYIARVQEDDVVREELVAIGDPAGEQQLVPKRRPTPFHPPNSHTEFGRRNEDGCMMAIHDNRRDRKPPRHWVTY